MYNKKSIEERISYLEKAIEILKGRIDRLDREKESSYSIGFNSHDYIMY